MRTMCSREIFTKKCRQQQIFDSDLKGEWHYNHVTFTPIAQNFMLYCRLIYMLSILCVRLTIKVKVGIPERFKVGWYPPPKKTGSSHLKMIETFSSMSGLRLNSKKTEALWIGSMAGNKEKLLPEKNFKWPENKVKVLGVWLSTDPDITA